MSPWFILSGSDFSHRPRISRHRRIGCQESDAFRGGLGDQYPVEGILVKRRQAVERHGMFAGDRQFNIAVIQQTTPQERRISTKVASTQAPFDGNLPQAGRAEDQFIGGVID